MRREVEAASHWLSCTFIPGADEADLQRGFAQSLQEMMNSHYEGHWYVDEPHRGCAYRSLTYAPPLVDGLLMRAAEEAGVRDAAFGSAQARGEADFLLWINPGEVKVLRGKGLPQIIYQTEGVQANPYGGLKLKIVPTVLNVRLDKPIDLDAPRERHVTSPEHRGRAPHMLAGAPSNSHVEGSVTPPSPFHHSPQMASNGGLDLRFTHPPSMTLPQNMGGGSVGSPMPGMGSFPGIGAMMQPPAQRPQTRPAPAFACS